MSRQVALEHPDLGRLEFGDNSYRRSLPDGGGSSFDGRGFVVSSLQIGSPAPRTVMRNRALADGAFDDTRFTGARAVTVGVRLADWFCSPVSGRAFSDMQNLYDVFLPYMDPARRPVLSWELPGGLRRQLTVRGDSAPVIFEGPKYPALVASFVAADGEITSTEVSEQVITPSEDTVEGREYDLEFPRTYPESDGIGDRIVTNRGNKAAHLVVSMFGFWSLARLKVNDVEIEFSTGAALGSRIDIDTRERTILLNGDPTQSRYHLTNFAEWSWSDLLLRPGRNSIRFTADVLGATANAVFRWRDTWY